ncbi:MAG: M20/M25/M40 family metallo-hydrolase [Pirellulaceae bacterium]
MWRRSVLAGLVCGWLAAIAGAQERTEAVDREVVARIREEGLQRSQVMETISYLTDVHGPRLTGSPGIRAAAEWTRQSLTAWGLEKARLEPWGTFGRGWSLEGFTANMVEPTFASLIAFPKAWSPSTAQLVRGTPIYLDASTEQELDRFRGKLHRAIVFLSPAREVKALFDAPARRQSDDYLLGLANSDGSFRGTRTPSGAVGTGSTAPPAASSPAGQSGNAVRSASQMTAKKWQLLHDEGAALVVEPGRGDGGTVFVGAVTLPRRAEAAATPAENNPFSRGPRPWSPDAPAAVPQVVMAVEHYNRCLRMLQKGVPLELEFDIAARFHTEDLTSFNVLAEIPGTDRKDEIVMLGGHFDSWHAGTGATDNAVGCGVALEAVRILQAIGVRPRRTIRIALWTGEEQGLLGSRAYVDQHFGRAVTKPPARRRSDEPSRPVTSPEAPPQPGGTAPAAEIAPQPAAKTTPSPEPNRSRPETRYELHAAHDQFAAYFNLDNGTGKIRGVYLQGNEAVRPIFRAWLTPFHDTGAATLTLNNTGGTDHLSFDAVGLPGFQFIQDPLEYDTRTHHSSMDVFDRVQADDMKQAAVIMASFVYHAAMRDEKLPRKALRGEVVRSP